LTLSEIEKLIASSLRLPVDKNYVSVALVRTNTLALYIWGEVKQPGKYLLDHPTSLMEAISQAGGPTDRARIKKVVIIRKGEKDLKVNLSAKYLQEHGPSDLMLKPYDTVVVTKKWSVSEFFLYGLLTAIGTASSVYVASKAR
jgi:polysaccharide biosynthesis/export protein